MAWLTYDITGKRVYIAGHSGMIGSALVRRFEHEDCTILTRTRSEMNLLDKASVTAWLMQEKPDVVIIAAGNSGGAIANPGRGEDFMYENLAIASHLIHGAYEAGVKQLINIAGPHIYPEDTFLPTLERGITGEQLNRSCEAASVVRLAALKLCQFYHREYGVSFRTVVPFDVYGPGDNFGPLSNRVIPAIICKAVEAKEANAGHMELSGVGTEVREFLYVDDCADAIVTFLKYYGYKGPVNIATSFNFGVALAELGYMIADIVGFDGRIKFLRKMQAGSGERRLCGQTLRSIGWHPQCSLEMGIRKTLDAFLKGNYREYDMKNERFTLCPV